MTARVSVQPPSHPLVLALIGTLVFLNVYAPQALLPLLARDFGSTPVQVGSVVGATTLAIALISPLSGMLADAAGRKRVVVAAFVLLTLPALLATQAMTLGQLNVARFVQGLIIPLVMVSCTAYAAEEYRGAGIGRAITAYVTGTVLGGFAGRFLSGIIVEYSAGGSDWRRCFWMLAATNLLGAALTALLLRRSRQFVPQRHLGSVALALKLHLRNRALLGTLAVGSALLFTLVAAFTYVVLHLAAPPYRLSSGALGSVFAVYLLGVLITPLAARLMIRFGARRALLAGTLLSLAGLGLTLLAPLPLIVLGLALASSGVFVGQAAAQNAVQRSVTQARSLASGLYSMAYYAGGAAATLVGGLVYTHVGWTGTVLLSAASLLGALATGLVTWQVPAALDPGADGAP